MRISVFWAVLALVAGLVLGAWGPRMDLLKARDEMANLRAQTAAAERRTTELQTVRAMLRLKDEQPLGRSRRRETPSSPAAAVSDTNATAAAFVPPPRRPAFESLTNSPTPAVSMRDGIRQASELWKTRSAVARNSFLSNTGMKGEEEATFDVLVEAMNLRLEDRILQWSDYLGTKKAINPEDGVRLINDLSSVLVLTYDEFDRRLPAGWREKAGENFQLFDFIDPEVAMPLADVEQLDNLGPRAGRGRNGNEWKAGAANGR